MSAFTEPDGPITPDQIDRCLRHYTRQIEQGRTAEKLRAAMIVIAKTAYPERYPQARLAGLTGVSQQAISKTLSAKGRRIENRIDGPYLLGRLLALAVAAGEPALGGVDAASAGTAREIAAHGGVTGTLLRRLTTHLGRDIAAVADRDSGLAARFEDGLAEIRAAAAVPSTSLSDDPALRRLVAAADGEDDGEIALDGEVTRYAMIEGYYAQRFSLKHGPAREAGGPVRTAGDIAARLR